MRRRKFLQGSFLGAALAAEAEENTSIYVPPAHKVEDVKVMHDFMDEFAFASVVTGQPSIRITHLPTILERGSGAFGKIQAHMALNNPQRLVLDGKHEGLILFRGPHRYISAGWYKKQPRVPTWNFTVVHAIGKPRLVEDGQALETFLEKLVAKFENYENTGYDFSKIPAGYKSGLRKGIVMFEMDIERLEGKFKLGIENAGPDRDSMLEGLKHAKPERSLLEFTQARIAKQ